MVSPQELERDGFPKSFKGYSVEEVDKYVDHVLTEYCRLFDEYNELMLKLSETKEELEIATNEEKAISVTLQRAQNKAKETVDAAEKQAHEIVDNAQSTAQKLVDDAQNTAQKLVSDAQNRSDEIKGAVSDGCDRILGVYLSKVSAEREKLLKCEKAVMEFKDDLYDAYRKHISMIDKLMPDKDLTPYLSDEELEDRALRLANENISPETKDEMKA